MHALTFPRWNERLPSACAALALQAALFALLAWSFQPLRREPEASAERIFYLPRMARPPLVIDARPAPRTPAAPSGAPTLPVPEIPPAPPPYTQAPPGNPSLLSALGRALACEADGEGRASPLMSCRKPAMPSPNDQRAPSLAVKRERELAAERARSQAPPRVPCTATKTFGGGGAPEEHSVMVDPLCLLGELTR
jgi:hypothetical protein